MKKVKVAFCLALVCALAAGASAATKGTKPAKEKAVGKAAAHGVSLTGCLQKGSSADTFMLTGVPGGKGKAAMKADWTLTGASADMKLSDHVGHKVRVTGTKDGDHQLKIASMKHIAATCP